MPRLDQALLLSSLIASSLGSSIPVKPMRLDLGGEVETKELPHKETYVYVAPKDIQAGCARFYISDPVKSGDTGTKWWQICSATNRDKAAVVEIGEGVFKKIQDHYGGETSNSISYISTGPDCWVDIFTEPKQKGRAYEITPLRDVDLSLLDSKDNPSQDTFNDNILSGTIRSTLESGENPDAVDTPSGITPVAIWYRFSGAPKQNADSGCGYFYDADPNGHDVNGIVVCVSRNQHLAHVSIKDLVEKQLILKEAGPQKLDVSSPWTGDEGHKTQYYSRGLRGIASRAGASFLSSLYDDMGTFWESVVEEVDSIVTSVAEVFTGPPPIFNITAAPSAESTQTPVREMKSVPADQTGIKYVQASADIDVAVFTEDEFQGTQKVVWAGSDLAIGDSSFPVVNSFFLISKRYEQTYVSNSDGELKAISKAAKLVSKEDSHLLDRQHAKGMANYKFEPAVGTSSE